MRRGYGVRLGVEALLSLILITAATRPAVAGGGVWTTGGPTVSSPGGACEGSSLAPIIDPTNPAQLYTLCGKRVYRSRNSGRSWALASAGLPPADTYLTNLALDPKTPSTLYVGTGLGGRLTAFKSTNSGDSWGPTTWTEAAPYLGFDVVDPTDPSTRYRAGAGGVLKSTDSGVTWTPASTGLDPLGVTTLAIDPMTPTTLYVATSKQRWRYTDGWIFKSTDAGNTWVGTGFSAEWDTPVYSFHIDPVTPSTLYALTSNVLYKSADAGVTWNPVTAGGNGYVRDLVLDPIAPSTLYAAAGSTGVLKSTNAAQSWTQVNVGLAGSSISGLSIDPVTPSTLYASSGAIFQSLDSGGTWTAPTTRVLRQPIRSLAIDPLTSGTVYAGTSTQGVFRSADWGETWSVAKTGLPSSEVRALTVDPATPTTLYAGTYSGVFRTSDSGESWTAASSGLPNLAIGALAIDPATTSTLYAGPIDSFSYTVHGYGVYKSTNSGSSWVESSVGLPYRAAILALAVDPDTPSTVYAGTYGGVYKSTDAGGTWYISGTGLPADTYFKALAIDPTQPSTVYAVDSIGVFRSSDGGGTWVPATTGLPVGERIGSLTTDRATPSTLYAATTDGVFKSIDSGNTWASFRTGLPETSFYALAQDPAGARTLYVGGGLGVWQLGPAVSTSFFAVAPCRVFDSRNSALGGPAALGAASTTVLPIASRCGIPSTAIAVAANVTVTAPKSPGSLTLSADNTLLPGTSTVNYSSGQTRSSNAVVGLGASGALRAFVSQQSGDAHVIIDVSGYFQ